MGRSKKNALDDLDQLLIEAQRIRANKDRQSAALPTVPISKRVMEFAQAHGAIKYREMRELLSTMTKCRKLESEFYRIATAKLSFKPDNWTLFFMRGQRDADTVGLIPETLEAGQGLVPRVAEIQLLYKQDKEVKLAYDEFEECWWGMDRLSYAMSDWIHEQFKNGSLEAKIISFKNKRAEKRSNISKQVISNLINPQKADAVQKTGELPDLSIGERQALQFLLGKIDNMTEREQYLKGKLLNGEKENPTKLGHFVVFELTEALKQSYGDINLTGYHYENLEQSLCDLLEKKRKFLIETEKETLELSLSLLQKLELRHKFREEPEFRSYVAVRIPHDVAKLHDKRYTAFPSDHFAQLRNTPPKTLLDKTEVRFFDFLRDEAPYKRKEAKTLRIRKERLLKLIGGSEAADHRHKSRLAERIETLYIAKAKNMNLLKEGKIETNADSEEVYVLDYQTANQS